MTSFRFAAVAFVAALAGPCLLPGTTGAGPPGGPKARPGPLMLIGGAEDKSGDATVLRAFVRAAGGPAARVLVLTYPEPNPKAAAVRYRHAFERLGVAHVRVFHLPDRATADSEGAAAAVDGADGVFFTGGGQWGIVGLIKGTRFEAALRRRWNLGVVVAGTSAGAALMPATMLSYGTSAVTPRAGDVDLDPGLGLIRGALVDSHFSQRGRINRLISALSERPSDLGVGIDEDTALVLDGDRFEVLGTGTVTVVDAAHATVNSRPKSARDRPIALSGVTLHVLPAGYGFDLKTRTPLAPADPRGG